MDSAFELETTSGPVVSRARSVTTLDQLPSPRRAYPWLGHLPYFSLREDMHLTLEHWARELGTAYQIRLGKLRVVVVSDSASTRAIMRARPRVFRRMSSLSEIMEEAVGPGVFTAEGERWRSQRKLVVAALSPRNLQAFQPLVTLSVERLRQHWHAASAQGEPLDVLTDLMRFTADVTTHIAFGVDVNTIRAGDHVLRRHLAQVFPAFWRRVKSPIPYWRYLKLPRDRALDRALAAIRRLLTPIIEDARAELHASPRERPRNFLDALLAAADREGQSLGADEVLANALTMLLAGEDTTANTLAWALHYLSRSPGTVQALREERVRLLSDRPLTPENVGSLPLLDAVLQETMRLKPTAAIFTNEALEDTVLGDLGVPASTVVWALPRLAVTREPLFSHPHAFQPERWLSANDPQRAAMVPFGYGPRLCPGRALAIMEALLVLGMVVQDFELLPCGEARQVSEINHITMAPRGLRLRLVERMRQAPRCARTIA